MITKKLLSFLSINHMSTAIMSVILLIAAFMRLHKIRGYMTYLGDEGRDVLIVKRMIVDGDIPFIGPTASVAAFFLGPFYYYLMAPFLWLSKLDPVGPAVMVALFGVATVYLIYKMTKEWYGTFAGVSAALLYTISPLVIAQSRSSWNPNVVPFFAALYVYSLYKALILNKNKWWLFIAGASLGAGVQLHYLFLFLVPVSLILFFYKPTRQTLFSTFTYFVGGVLFPLVPFIGFEIKNNFPNLRTIVRFLTAGEEVSYGNTPLGVLSDVLFRLFARLAFYFPGPDQYYRFQDHVLSWWKTGIVITILVCAGLVLYRAVIYKKIQDILLFCWLFFGTVLFIFYQKAIYDYYLVIIFPVPFILIGALLQRLLDRRYLWPVACSALFLLVWLNWSGRPFQFSPNNQVEHTENIARFVYEKAESEPFNFALVTASNSDHAYRYFFEIWGNHPVVIENFDVDPERTTVTEQLLVLCEQPDCEPLGHSLWQIAGFGPAVIEHEWIIESMQVYKLVHAEE